MSQPAPPAGAPAADSSTADGSLASKAAAAVRSRIQAATPKNASYVDHTTGRIKSQASLPQFWMDLQQTQGWLHQETARAAATDPAVSLEDIISTYTPVFVCSPLARQGWQGQGCLCLML
jgi:hypothetical protein